MLNDWNEIILDRFRYIENRSGDDKPGVSAVELSRHFKINRSAASQWLSKWCNYYSEKLDTVFHILRVIKANPLGVKDPFDPEGRYAHYKVGPDDYSDFAWAGNRECQRQVKLDFSGLKPMHLDDSGKEIKTRTDNATKKRTAAGLRTTNEKLYWIKEMGGEDGISTAEYAQKFKVGKSTAATTLSRWKRYGLVVYENRKYKVSNKASIVKPVAPYETV